MENIKSPETVPSFNTKENITGVSQDQLQKLTEVVDNYGGLAEISTIEWGNRMHEKNRLDLFDEYRAEYRIVVDENGDTRREYTGRGKDYQQSERLEKIRSGEARFDDLKEWYFQLGAEPDIFEPQGNKPEDLISSNSIRMYLVKSAQMIIDGIKDDNTEFQILRNKSSDKRTLAANMLMEAAILGLNNGAEPEETLKLLDTSINLLEKVINSQNTHTDEARLYIKDAIRSKIFLLKQLDQKDPEIKKDLDNAASRLDKIGDPELQIINKLYTKEKTNEIIGEASEALVSLILQNAIRKTAGDIILARKAFLREDMPADWYIRNGERRMNNVAADLIVYVYSYDDDDLILNKRVPLQIKFTGDKLNETDYDRRVKIIKIEDIGKETRTEVRRIGDLDNIFNKAIRTYRKGAQKEKDTFELNDFEIAMVKIIEPKGGIITESVGL